MRPSLNLLPGETVQRIIDEGFALLENPGIELHNLEGRELLLAAVTRRSFIICQVENSRRLIPSPDSLHKCLSRGLFNQSPCLRKPVWGKLLSAEFPTLYSPFPNTSIYAKLFLGHSTNLLSVSGVLTTLSGDKPEERRI